MAPRNRIHLATVKEFFASLEAKQFYTSGVVQVQGREIQMTIEAINEFYGLETHRDFRNAYPDDPSFLHNRRPLELPVDLRENREERWNAKTHEIRREELPFMEKFWNIFCCHSIIPTSKRTEIIPARAKVLYCIKHGHPMDVGHLIKMEIAANAKTLKKIIFPSLITHFCVMAGIIAYNVGEGWEDGATSMGYIQWNASDGVPVLAGGAFAEEERQAQEEEDAAEQEVGEEENEEDAAADPDYAPPSDQLSQILQLQQQMLQGQQDFQQQVIARLDSQDQRLNTLETRIIEEFDARLQQFEHQGSFQYVPRQHKQAGGASGSSQASPH